MQVSNYLFKPQLSLAPFLLLALLVHLLALSLIKVMKHAPVQAPLTFDVRLMPVKKNQAQDVVLIMQKIEKVRMIQTKAEVKPEAKPEKTLPKPAIALKNSNAPEITADLLNLIEKTTEKTIEKQVNKSNISTENLLDSARRIAIEEAKNMPKDKSDNIALADREFSPKLAAAMGKLNKLPAGIYNIANGQIKIVNADGSEYCLIPPVGSAMPASAFGTSPSIPMTCP